MNIGFIKSRKENEKRVAIVYSDILSIKQKECLFFEENYFEDFNISDDELRKIGCNVLKREEVLKCDIICDPKVGDAEYLNELHNQTIFGWVHATQNKQVTDILIKSRLTVYAWEKMFENDVHVFYKNNEIAGEASVLHALLKYGSISKDLKAAIIGNGNTSRGAKSTLEKLGIKYCVYTREDEKKFQDEVCNYDIIINAILWDTSRKDHIIYRNDLKKLKNGALIIDISCDHNGAIESSHPTTLNDPIYFEDGVMHYAVDHTPTLLFKDASVSISKVIVKYINMLITNSNINDTLKNALIIEKGKILDKEIIEYQNR